MARDDSIEQRVQRYLSGNDPDRAIAELTRNGIPTQPVRVFQLAQSYQLKGDYATAQQTLQTFIRANPDYREAYNKLAQITMERSSTITGQYAVVAGYQTAAEALYRAELIENDTSSDPRETEESMRRLSDQLRQEVSNRSSILTGIPDFPVLCNTVAELRRLEWDFERAKDMLILSVTADNQNPKTFAMMGKIAQQEGYEHTALQCYQSAARLDPRNEKIKARLAELLGPNFSG
jgi:tetratricopeptide (TPR) repeat protein